MALRNKENKEKVYKKLKNKYELVVYDKETLNQELAISITIRKALTYTSIFVFVIAVIVALLFVFTPLNFMLPVQQSNKLSRQLVNHVYQLDSLKREISIRDRYFANIQNIMNGKRLENFEALVDTNIRHTKIEFERSKHDSVLRKQIEKEEKQGIYNISENSGGNVNLKNLHFFKPIKGIVTSKFDIQGKHPAVDIVAEPNEPVLATLEGTVIISTWSMNTGYIIQVQHANNLISVYKHNSSLLKESGDHVNSGEPIAILGNTGELSTGPHLHFELWYNGSPLNPEDYITF